MPTEAPQTPPAAGQTGTLVDPYRSYNFKLNIQGVNEGHFTQCSGLGVKIESIAYREAGDPLRVRCLPGRVAYGEVTFAYGLTSSIEMWQWFLGTLKGTVQRRDISILMLGDTGEEVLRWNLLRSWISEWRGAPLDALGREAAIESMTLVYEGLDRA